MATRQNLWTESYTPRTHHLQKRNQAPAGTGFSDPTNAPENVSEPPGPTQAQGYPEVWAKLAVWTGLDEMPGWRAESAGLKLSALEPISFSRARRAGNARRNSDAIQAQKTQAQHANA